MATSMTAAESDALKRRARLSMIALGLRSLGQNVITLVSNVYLARLLTPADYGIVSILQFAMSVLRLVGDAGLAAALIQRSEAPEERALSSLFWLQLGIGLVLVACASIVAPYIRLIWPALPESASWLLRGLSLSLLFTLLRSVPFLVLERNVRFGLIGALEFFGTLGFHVTAVVLALRGAGAASLVTAAVVQSGLISAAAIIAQRYRPRFVFDWQAIRGLLRFGVAFQGTNAVNFINGTLAPLLVGAYLGPNALGLVEFAQNTAWFPTNIVGIIRRVTFPYLSRIQHDKQAFAREFERIVTLSAIPIYLFMGLFLGAAPLIVRVVYSAKWLPAIPALYVYSLVISINFFSWIGGAALEALGATGRMFRLIVVATTINCVACVVAVWWSPTPLSFALGFSVHMLVNSSAIYWALRDLVPSKPLSGIAALVVAGATVAVVGRGLQPYLHGVLGVVVWGVVGTATYAGVALLCDRRLRALAAGLIRERWGAKPAGSSKPQHDA
ncbi:MAG: hypothetical protein RL701_4218 [Pseudomonadota bacterium]